MKTDILMKLHPQQLEEPWKKIILKDFPFFWLLYILEQDHQSEILALWQPNLKPSAQAKSILVQWLGEDIKDENQNIISLTMCLM